MAAQLEAERKEYESQLELVVASLRDDPDNGELGALKEELEQMIALIDDSLADLRPKAAAHAKRAPSPPPPPPEEPPKWSRENHPAFKKEKEKAAAAAAAAEEEEKEIIFKVNDNVMAKWLSGDKGFYPAKIVSVTGSSTAPIYTVKFKSYDTVETVRGRDVRPVGGSTAGTKRKADGSSVAGPSSSSSVTATPTVGSGIVASVSADMYPEAAKAAAAKAAEGDDKPKPKFKKIKANKELEAGKNKWQEFNSKGKFGKAAKKESMFRTPEGIKGRVGFTGSGQAMRKDPTRSRHVYQPNEDLD